MPAFVSTVVAVFAALLFEEWYAESALPAGDVLTQLPALALWLVPVAVVEALFRYTRWRFRAGRPFEPRRYAGLVSHLPLPLYFVALFHFRWPEILVPLRLESVVVLDTCVVLLPFALVLVATLVQVGRLEHPLHVTTAGFVPAPPRAVSGAVREQLRQLLLPLAPMVVLLVLFDVVQDTRLNVWFDYVPLLGAFALLALFLALLAVFPSFAKWVLGMQPMQAGSPLRQRLETFSARIGFSCRDYLYWRTRRPMLNAALLGVWSRFRFVIFTEELLRRLTLDEITDVFAHEAGHGTRHHAVYSILSTAVFVIVLLPLSSAAGEWIELASGGRYDAAFAATMFVQFPAFLVYWRFGFGPLSRRFELEADIEGVRATGDVRTFVATLEKVARVARLERATRGRRHFSIQGRAEFLARVFEHGDDAALVRFEDGLAHTRKWIRAGAIAALLGVLTWTALDSMTGMAAIALERGDVSGSRRLLEGSRWWNAGQPRALALRVESACYAEPDAGGRPRHLDPIASTWIESKARAAVAELRAGWSRAIVNGRPDVALTLVDVAEALNARGALPREPAGPQGAPAADAEGQPSLAAPGSNRLLDPDARLDLADMREVAELVVRGDRKALRAFLSTSPRWLRRPDAKAAAEALRERAQEDSKTVSGNGLR